jgi:prevent-host-death family protein
MIEATATEFKANLGKYLTLAGREDIHITKNGAEVAILVAPKAKSSWVDELTGIIPNDGLDRKQARAERLARKHEGLD